MDVKAKEWVVEWYSPIGWSLSYNAAYEMNGHIATTAEINNWVCKLEEAMAMARYLQDNAGDVFPLHYRVRNKRTNDILPVAIL